MPTVHLLIKGKVQGVFFRASAKKEAARFGITGWIKNTDEGDVEARITASENELENFINWCKKGPDNATVNDVIITSKPPETFSGFVINK
ncbi:MAG: acylphosphatase [Chitinophagaceae bacterium]|nr:acylphosphatase [Chitinophagaceae bacterium]